MKGLVNVGDVLAGKYRVERILGIGGMGMVVLATHLELDQQVAIKFMLPNALENPEAAARFTREARAAARLTSEHICRVSDVGKFESGVPYIVMEYLEGFDLGTMLKRKGPLSVAAAVDYIIQAAEGMAEAHGHGIVHRDLKPDNLFLHTRSDGSQVIKVLDFGISKASVTGIATKTGDIMGSPAYMAPEQMASTKDVDARADIWSLGVILYQLIAGRLPFIADTLPALCMAVINDAPPSLESVRRELPHGFAQVVSKCLAKRKDDRFRNVHELAQALAPYGKPETMAAITRIRSMLQRRRPTTTQPPLMMLPSEFADVAPVAPTLMGDDLAPQIIIESHATPLPVGATETTLGGSGAGESMSAPGAPRPVNRGVVGALVGAIAMVGLIIVMVLVRRDNDADASPTVVQPVAQPAVGGPPPTIEPLPVPRQPEVQPDPTPITPPNAAGTPDPNELIEVIDSAPHKTPTLTNKKRDKKHVDNKSDKSKGQGSGAGSGDGDGSAVPTNGGTAGSGSNTGAGAGSGSGDDDDDKWNHMHHDRKPDPEAPK